MCDNRIFHIVHSALELSPNATLASKVTQGLNCLRVIASHRLFAKPSDRPRQTFESTHPYEHNLNTKKTVRFAGAARLEVSFDSECRTENRCDYLRFFCRGKQVGLDKYHGDSRQAGCKWPDLVVDGDELQFTFFSDGSTNDWGYKFDVFAVFDTGTDSFYLLGQELSIGLMHVISDLCIVSGSFVIPSASFSDDAEMQFTSLAVKLMRTKRIRKAFEATLSEAVSSLSPCHSLIFAILCQFLQSDEPIYESACKHTAVVSQSPPEWAPAIKGRVVRAGDWMWHDQDVGTFGTITSLDNKQWIGVRWDLGGTNFYRYGLDGKFDLKGFQLNTDNAIANEPVVIESTKILPKDWFLSVINNVAFSLFDSSFDSTLDASLYSSAESIEALSCRIIDFIDSFSSKVTSSCRSIPFIASTSESLVAQLAVYACFRHRLFESIFS